MKAVTRKLVAVGDLHGDFYRLVRILSEQNFLNPDTLEWTPEAGGGDVILLGDYVDWRGEPLEGASTEWLSGARRIVELLYSLSGQLEKLRKTGFHGCFYPLLGNHDEMMLDGYSFVKKLVGEEPSFLDRFLESEDFINFHSAQPLGLAQEDDFLDFVNWHSQGGKNTIRSFGGLSAWFSAMEGNLGNFLRSLPLTVAINKKLFSHSIPDSKKYWIPLHRKNPDSPEEYAKIREQYLWGRRVWGYDVFEGAPAKPLTEEEIDEMLKRLGVKSVVVGHTPLSHGEPYFHFGGKVINLDTHGIPGSPGFVEEYTLFEKKKKRGKTQMKRRMQEKKHYGRD